MMSTAHTKTKSILMLHGGPGFYGYMNSLGQRLPQHHEATYFPQRGTLANPKPLDNLSLEAHLRDIDAQIGKFPHDRDICIIGHSWGANLALLYAAHNPGKLTKVVALAPLTMESAQKFESNLNQRMSPADRARSDELELNIEAHSSLVRLTKPLIIGQ